MSLLTTATVGVTRSARFTSYSMCVSSMLLSGIEIKLVMQTWVHSSRYHFCVRLLGRMRFEWVLINACGMATVLCTCTLWELDSSLIQNRSGPSDQLVPCRPGLSQALASHRIANIKLLMDIASLCPNSLY